MAAPTPKKQTSKTPKGVSVIAKQKTDWEAVERDYRSTNMTLRELASKHNCLNTSIANKAKRHGWSRDLTGAIHQATQTALIEASIADSVSKREQSVSNTVLATAEVNKNVILSHRTGLQRLISVKAILLGQIEQAALNMTDLSEVIEMVRSPDDSGMDRANDALRKAMGRSALIDDLKKLADVDEKVRKGEREAFSLNDDKDKTPEKDASRYTDTERAVKLSYLLAKAQGRT